MRKLIAALVLGLPLISAAADRPADLQALPEVPPPPAAVPDDTEPQITIKQKGENKMEEYSIHGHVYMIKVTPPKGKPYYLVDTKGDGQFSRQDGLGPDVHPPMWVIHSW
jgi:hypothetical protein